MQLTYGYNIKSAKLLLAHGAAVGLYQVPDWVMSEIKNKKQFKRLMMLLFSSGLDLLGLDKEYTKEALLMTELSLKNICREAIRNHLLQMSNVNIFIRVPRLPLPKALQSYLLYDQTLNEDHDEDDDDDDDDNDNNNNNRYINKK